VSLPQSSPTLLLIIALLAVLGLIVLVARFKLSAFLSLILASLFVGVCSGMDLAKVAKSFQDGVGATLGFVAIVVGLGTMLGKMLAESGGAEVVARPSPTFSAKSESIGHWYLSGLWWGCRCSSRSVWFCLCR